MSLHIGPVKKRDRHLRDEVDHENLLRCTKLFDNISITNVIAKTDAEGVSNTLIAFGTVQLPCRNGDLGCPIDIAMKISFQHMAAVYDNITTAIVDRSLIHESRIYEYIYETFKSHVGNADEIYNFVPYVKSQLCRVRRPPGPLDAMFASPMFEITNTILRIKSDFINGLKALYTKSTNSMGAQPDHILVLITELSGTTKLYKMVTDDRISDVIMRNFMAQLLISTKISQAYGIQQNDMHANNVLVDLSPAVTTSEPLIYLTGNDSYDFNIEIKYGKLLFFDWDRGIYPTSRNLANVHFNANARDDTKDIYTCLNGLSHVRTAPEFNVFYKEITTGIYLYTGKEYAPSIDELLNFPYFDKLRIAKTASDPILFAAKEHVRDIEKRISRGLYSNKAEAELYLEHKKARVKMLSPYFFTGLFGKKDDKKGRETTGKNLIAKIQHDKQQIRDNDGNINSDRYSALIMAFENNIHEKNHLINTIHRIYYASRELLKKKGIAKPVVLTMVHKLIQHLLDSQDVSIPKFGKINTESLLNETDLKVVAVRIKHPKELQSEIEHQMVLFSSLMNTLKEIAKNINKYIELMLHAKNIAYKFSIRVLNIESVAELNCVLNSIYFNNILNTIEYIEEVESIIKSTTAFIDFVNTLYKIWKARDYSNESGTDGYGSINQHRAFTMSNPHLQIPYYNTNGRFSSGGYIPLQANIDDAAKFLTYMNYRYLLDVKNLKKMNNEFSRCLNEDVAVEDTFFRRYLAKMPMAAAFRGKLPFMNPDN